MANERELLYVESSALLAALRERDPQALQRLVALGAKASSALTLAEAARGLVRAKLAGRLSDLELAAVQAAILEFQDGCAIVEMDAALLARLGRPFPVEPVRTLDAIHFATREALANAGESIVVLTRNALICDNARAPGFSLA